MSLSKIPIIVLVTLALRAGLTVHHPPPSKTETVQTIAIDIPKFRKIRFKIFHVPVHFSLVISSPNIFVLGYPNLSCFLGNSNFNRQCYTIVNHISKYPLDTCFRQRHARQASYDLSVRRRGCTNRCRHDVEIVDISCLRPFLPL